MKFVGKYVFFLAFQGEFLYIEINKLRNENKRMKDVRKGKIWFWLFAISTLGFMVFIFSMSAQDAEASALTSEGLTRWLAEVFYGPDATMTEEMIRPVAMLVRKTAHMTEYAILFLLSYGTVHFYGESYGGKRKSLPAKLRWLIAYGWTVFYAATDEFHQSFVGRGATPVDVMIDAFGALIGTALLLGAFQMLTAKGVKKKAGWVVATLAVMFCIYALSFLLFHREVFGLFF